MSDVLGSAGAAGAAIDAVRLGMSYGEQDAVCAPFVDVRPGSLQRSEVRSK